MWEGEGERAEQWESWLVALTGDSIFREIELHLWHINMPNFLTESVVNFSEKVKHESRGEVFLAQMEPDEHDYSEDLKEVLTYSVELPVSQHHRQDVKAAKLVEVDNLANFGVFEKVEDIGQPRITSRWVVTEKNKQDGQKQKVKLSKR